MLNLRLSVVHDVGDGPAMVGDGGDASLVIAVDVGAARSGVAVRHEVVEGLGRRQERVGTVVSGGDGHRTRAGCR